MFETLTYIFDRARIMFGDSECPLGHRCPGYGGDNDSCSSYRGRTDTMGERAQCYSYFKPQIRERKRNGKEGFLEKIAGKIATGIMKVEGIDDD